MFSHSYKRLLQLRRLRYEKDANSSENYTKTTLIGLTITSQSSSLERRSILSSSHLHHM